MNLLENAWLISYEETVQKQAISKTKARRTTNSPGFKITANYKLKYFCHVNIVS